MENSDGVAIGNRYNFAWPGKAGGRYGEEEQKKGEAGTTHAGLPWLVVVLSCLPHDDQESNLGKMAYPLVINK